MNMHSFFSADKSSRIATNYPIVITIDPGSRQPLVCIASCAGRSMILRRSPQQRLRRPVLTAGMTMHTTTGLKTSQAKSESRAEEKIWREWKRGLENKSRMMTITGLISQRISRFGVRRNKVIKEGMNHERRPNSASASLLQRLEGGLVEKIPDGQACYRG